MSLGCDILQHQVHISNL